MPELGATHSYAQGKLSRISRTGVISTVEMMSWYLSVVSISSTRRAGRMSVAMNVVSRDTMMPAAVISSGNDIATCAGQQKGT